MAASPSEDERQQQEELAKQLKEKGFSTEFEIAKTAANVTTTTVTLHYNGKPITSPYYKADILQTSKELEENLINVGGVERKTAQLFITWFTNEILISNSSKEEKEKSTSAATAVVTSGKRGNTSAACR